MSIDGGEPAERDHDGPSERGGHSKPVDTARAPHEPSVRTASTIGLWLLVLAGPGTWIVHFSIVYLTAEASCAADTTTEMSFLGTAGTETVVVVATVVGIALCMVDAVVCRRRASEQASAGLLRVGTLLALFFAVAIFMVGVPVLALPVCGP
jgi:hypothetical protein